MSGLITYCCVCMFSFWYVWFMCLSYCCNESEEDPAEPEPVSVERVITNCICGGELRDKTFYHHRDMGLMIPLIMTDPFLKGECIKCSRIN